MKIQFWSVGKPHEPYVKTGVDDFTKRIGNYHRVEWVLIPGPRNASALSEQELRRKEAELIQSRLTKDDVLILLDERGKQVSSEGLAKLIQTKANESTRSLVFLIGGAFGVEDSIRQKANFVWSISELVFPHQLVRLILAEQVYRACTIIKNEKYHHK